VTSTLLLRCRRGTGLGLVARLVAFGAVALLRGRGGIYVAFAWQAWHLVTWMSLLRGKRDTYGPWLGLVARLVALALLGGSRGIWRHRRCFHVASVAHSGAW